MFKLNDGMYSEHISELFKRLDTNYNVRNSDIVIPRYNSITYGKYSVIWAGVHPIKS